MAEKLQALVRQGQVELARRSFISYVRMIAPWFTIEEVHVIMGFYLERVAFGKCDRLRIHTGPRGGKSLFVSVFFVSWYIGLNPHDKVFEAANTADLASTFGEQVLDILQSDIFRVIFPAFKIRKKSTKRMRFTASSQRQSGEWQGFGMGGRIAGRGFHLGVLDDPLTEQEYLSTGIKEKQWNWYQVGFYTRRQPEKNAIIVMATRWAHDDIPGRLEQQEKNGGDKYEVLSIPAVVNRETASILSLAAQLDPLPPTTKDGKPYYVNYKPGMSYAPRRFPAWLLRKTKNAISDDHWNALYIQRPTADDGKIIKRSFWKPYIAPQKKNRFGQMWTELPELLYVILVADTAHEEKQTADYSAIQAWGVYHKVVKIRGEEFKHRVPILLESWRDRVELPELKLKLRDFVRRWSPDEVFVEKKSSGVALYQEMKTQIDGMHAWLPKGKTKDKVSRAWRAALVMAEVPVYFDSAVLENGDAIDECAKFPYDINDDYVDTVTMAISILRDKHFLDIKGDILEPWEKDKIAMTPPSDNTERRPF